MSRAREVFKQISLYATASYITQFLAVVAGIITRNFLGPYFMGIWATLQLVINYCDYSGLGIDAALSREYPYCIGKGDEEGAARIRDLVTSFGIMTALVTSVAVLFYALINGKTWPRYLFWGIVATPVLLITQRFSNTIVNWLRASKQFKLASYQIVLSGIVNLTLIILLASWLKFAGFLLAMVLSCFFNIAFLLTKSSFHFRFRINREVLRLIGFGLPLLFVGILFDLLRSVDKILVIRYLGFEQMGIYGVATMAAVLISKIPDSIVIVLIPHFHEKFGVREQANDLRNLVDRSALAYNLIMPLIIGAGWIFAEPLAVHFLPKFVTAVPAMKLLLLSTYFFALFYPYSNFLIAVKRHLVLFPVIGSAIFIQFLLTFSVIKSGWGLKGVASVAILCYFLNYLGLFIVTARSLYNKNEMLEKFLFAVGLFILLATFLMALDRFCMIESLTQRTFLEFFLFSMMSLPIFITLEKEFGIFNHMRAILESRKK